MNDNQLAQLLSQLAADRPSPTFTMRVMAKVRERARLQGTTMPIEHDPFTERMPMSAHAGWGNAPAEPPAIEAVYRWHTPSKGDAA